MPGKKTLFAVLTLAAHLAATGVANAATANFQGDCATTQVSNNLYKTSCLFNPNKAPVGEPFTDCNGGGVQKYWWDFGDGYAEITYPLDDYGRARHTYYHQGYYISINSVWLQVICNNGKYPWTTHCLATQTPGCIVPGAGWTP